MAERSTNRRRRRHQALTDRDRALLEFIAAHRFVTAAQAKVFLDASPSLTAGRLRALARQGLISRDQIFRRGPEHCQITRSGLDVIGSDLPRPRLDLREYQHDVGVVWLWLAAHAGLFGELREIVAERDLRSRDGRREPDESPLAVRLGGRGPAGHERLHYPDLLLVDGDGRRIALELELTQKSRTRIERILAGYAVDNRIDDVVYLVDRDSVGRSIEAAARKLRVSDLIRIQRVELTEHQSLSRETSRGRGRVQPRQPAMEPAGPERAAEAI